MTGLLLTWRTIPVCTYVRKPGRLASKRYGPTARFGNTYEPVSLLIVFREMPVSVCVKVTSTPGSTAPLSSFAVPLISAVPCAQIVTEENITRQHVSAIVASFISILQPRGLGRLFSAARVTRRSRFPSGADERRCQ